MQYNRLKQIVLESVSGNGWFSSKDIDRSLRNERNVEVSIRALQMALLRYFRQGLLERERHSGRYLYRLSSRGGQRLSWLRSLARSSTE